MSSTDTTETTAAQSDAPRHGLLSGILIAVAVIFLTIGVLTAWLRLEMLDKGTWDARSRATIQSKEVQAAVATFAIDKLNQNVDTQALVAQALPDRYRPLAGPLNAALQSTTEKLALKAIASQRVQDAWVTSNTTTHDRFVKIIRGDSPVVKTTSDGVKLDLAPIVSDVAKQVGISPSLVAQIPADSLVVTPKHSQELQQAIMAFRLLDKWGGWIGFIGVGLLVVGLWIGRGHRRRLVMGWGIGVFFGAVIIDAAASQGGTIMANAISNSNDIRAAILSSWNLTTEVLQSMINMMYILAFASVLGAWVTAPNPAPTAVRRWLAPSFRKHVEISWVVFGFVMLYLLTSVDALSERRALTQVVVLALAAAGFEAIRRQTVREFPGEDGGKLGDWMRGAWARSSEWVSGASKSGYAAATSAGSAALKRGDAPGGEAGHAVTHQVASTSMDDLDKLDKLAGLHERGAISDEEYTAFKQSILPE